MHIKTTTKVAPVSFLTRLAKSIVRRTTSLFSRNVAKNAQQAKSTAENQIKMAKTYCSSSSSSSEIILVWAQFGPLYLLHQIAVETVNVAAVGFDKKNATKKEKVEGSWWPQPCTLSSAFKIEAFKRNDSLFLVFRIDLSWFWRLSLTS